MPEADVSWQTKRGVDVDASHCRQKLYTVLALFLASEPISELKEGHQWGAISRAVEEHETPLILHLLIECAVLIRILDDQFKIVHGKDASPGTEPVGLLFQPIDNEPGVPLYLRQSCNKVIHAEGINFDVEPDHRDEVNYLTPTLHLYGTERRVSWKAQLEIKEWVRAGLNLTSTM